MRVGFMFITSVVNNLYAIGFELKPREAENASIYFTLSALHRGFDKQAYFVT